MEIRDSTFRIIAKPNSRKNEVIGYNKEKGAYIITIKEKAEDNKVNIELIRFLSKELGKRVRIKSGFSSRIKIIETHK